MAKYQRPIPGSPEDAPYKQSRYSLRERFGPRAIDASAPPSQRNEYPSAGIGTFGGGLTAPDKWKGFFDPVTPSTGMFSRGTLGATGASPLGGQSNVASMIEGVPVQSALPQATPTPTMASTAPLQSAPVDYLKAAHQRSTEFWKNAQGNRIATPTAMGAPVQAGTSFRSKFGTGSVVSAESQKRMQGLMRLAVF